MTKQLLEVTLADFTNQTPAYQRWSEWDKRYTIHPDIERAVEFCTSDDREKDAVDWRRDFRDFRNLHSWAVEEWRENTGSLEYHWDDVLPYWDRGMICAAVEYYHDDWRICPVRAFANGSEVNAGELKG